MFDMRALVGICAVRPRPLNLSCTIEKCLRTLGGADDPLKIVGVNFESSCFHSHHF